MISGKGLWGKKNPNLIKKDWFSLEASKLSVGHGDLIMALNNKKTFSKSAYLCDSLLAFSDLVFLCTIYWFWSAVACWINLTCIFNTVWWLPPNWNQHMPGQFTHVLMNLPWRPHLISELSMTQAMWLFPTCLLLVGKQQVDLSFFFPLNCF